MRPAFKEVLLRALRVLKHTRCRDMVFEVSKHVSIAGQCYVPFRVTAFRGDNEHNLRPAWQHGRWFLMPLDHTEAYMTNLCLEAFHAFEAHEMREQMKSTADIDHIYPPH